MIKRLSAVLPALVLAVGLGAAAPAYASPDNPVVDHGIPGDIQLADKPLPGTRAHPKGKPPNPRGGVSTQTTVNCGGAACYKFAGKQDNSVTGSDGPQSVLSVHSPGLLPYDYHSAAVLTSQNGSNTVEFGWMVNNNLHGDYLPRLFADVWISGTFNGYSTGFVPVASPVKTLGATVTSGSNITLDIRHFTTTQCACATAGWWLAYNSSFIGVFPDTLWSGGFTTTTLVQSFGEMALGYDPSQSDMGNGTKATAALGAQFSSYGLFGTSPSTPAWDATVITESDRWTAVSTGTGQNFRYGGPGGTNNITGATGADLCSGVASVGNGEVCGYGSYPASVPTGRSWSIDEASSTSFCWQNIGTAGGFAATNYIGLSGYKKIVWFRDSTCSGASQILDTGSPGIVTLPAGWNNLATASLKISATYRSCATGYPTTPPTC